MIEDAIESDASVSEAATPASRDAIEIIKSHAARLHRRVRKGDVQALARIGRLPEFRDAEPSVDQIQRKHCLAALSRTLGFSGWPHARRVLEGDPDEHDFGTTLHPRQCSGFTNQWFADYEPARRTRALTDGYLLTYRRQFFVVTRQYVEALGASPDDPDWVALGWDWARPRQPAARRRLYATLITAQLRDAS